MKTISSLTLAVANLRVLHRMLAERLGQGLSPDDHEECLAISHAMELMLAEADSGAETLAGMLAEACCVAGCFAREGEGAR